MARARNPMVFRPETWQSFNLAVIFTSPLVFIQQVGVFRRTAAIERQAGRLKGSSEARTGAFQAMSSGSTSILTLVWAAKCAQTCDPSLPLAPLGPGWSDWTPVQPRRGAAWHRQFGPQACPDYAMPKTTISTVGLFYM